jgi:hypothetical protein
MHIQMMWPQEEVVNYTLKPYGWFLFLGNGFVAGRLHVGYWEKWILYHLKNGSKNRSEKMFPKSIFAVSGTSILCCIHAKNGWIYITYAYGRRRIGTIRANWKRKSRPNRITIQMRGKYNQGTAFWFPELYLTMKVICTSQQENVAQSLSIHKTSQNVKMEPLRLHADGRIPAQILCR